MLSAGYWQGFVQLNIKKNKEKTQSKGNGTKYITISG
jgi:hypothetical protein